MRHRSLHGRFELVCVLVGCVSATPFSLLLLLQEERIADSLLSAVAALVCAVLFSSLAGRLLRPWVFRPLDACDSELRSLATAKAWPPEPAADSLPFAPAINALLARAGREQSLQHEAVAKAEREQASLRALLDSMPIGVFSHMLEVDGRLVRYVNAAHRQLVGADPETEIHIADHRLTHPEDAGREAVLQERLRRGEIDRFSLEKRLLRPDGSTVWVVSTFQRRDYPDGTLQEISTLVDITELRRARELSEREKARLRFILDSMPVGVSSAILESDGKLTRYANPAQERITGLSREQHAQPAAYSRLTHPEDAGREAGLQERLRRGEIDRFSLEKRLLRPDGSTVWVVSTYQRRDYADGTLEELAILVDVTELRRARELSEREQARLRFILDSMPVGVSSAILESDGKLTRYANPAQERITGLSREQHAQPAAYSRLTHPEDAGREAGLQERLRRGEIDRFSLEKRLLRPDGSTVWVVSTYQRRDYADGTLEELATFVDVTELRLAQEKAERERARFRLIFEAIPVGVDWMLLDDPSTRVVNPAHARITGVPAELASADPGREWEATHPDDRARQHELEARLASGEIDSCNFEKRYLRPDGSVGWAEVRLLRHPDPVTGGAQRIATLVDLDERKRAEAEINRIHRQLVDASREAGMAEVATGVLHNVGNVLNSVNISCNLIAERIRRSKAPNLAKLRALLESHAADLPAFLADDPKGRMIVPYLATLSDALAEEQRAVAEEVGNLRSNIDHIKEIVSMQQEYARTGGVSETLPAVEIVEDALRMNAGALVRHDVELQREYRDQPVVTVDKNKVLQILINLLRNAKYACDETGRPEKRITVRVAVEAGLVVVEVIDNGVGIPPENLTRIFSHGFTTRKNGHGFGLHSGALAAKQIGGSLLAYSDGPGRGARFELRFPVSPSSTTASSISSE